MRTAIQEEIRGISERGTFEIVCREELKGRKKKPNIMGGRFVLAIKNIGNSKEDCKARFVVQGHTDVEKALLVHNSTTMQKGTICSLIALAAISGFRL